MNNDEIWKPLGGIPEIEGEFLISNQGRIRRILFTHPNQKEWPAITKQHADYRYVMFVKGSWNKCCRLHRLVAQHFVENPNGYKEVNHIDGDKGNNAACNLEWVTRSQNERHKYDVLGYEGAMKGKHLSDGAKQKIRDYRTGTHQSEETKNKVSEALKAKHLHISPEQREKMVEGLREYWLKQPRKVKEKKERKHHWHWSDEAKARNKNNPNKCTSGSKGKHWHWHNNATGA